MAEIAKVGIPSISTVLPGPPERISGDLLAGENLGACDACYINPADGLVYRSVGSAAAGSDSAQVHGWTALPAKQGQATTLYKGINFHYAASLTPGRRLYLSGITPGGLADAPSTGGTGTVAFTVDAQRIHVKQSGY